MLSRLPRAVARPLLRAAPVRAFSASRPAHMLEEVSREEIDTKPSLWNFTEEENMLRDTGA
jgi:hypothetical protein